MNDLKHQEWRLNIDGLLHTAYHLKRLDTIFRHVFGD